MKKVLIAMLTMILVFSMLTGTFAADGAWQLDDYGWWYLNEDGSYPAGEWEAIDGYWYHFSESGYMETGWLLDSGVWYYMNPSGIMATGWVLDNGYWYYMSGSGALASGWQLIDDVWYYFGESGFMSTGWQEIDGTWYYFDESGAMVTGSRYIDGTYYEFSSSGAWKPDAYEPQDLPPAQPTDYNYIANKNTKKFHRPDCSSVDNMNESNKLYFPGTRDELIAMGYDPCKNCNP